QFVGRPVDGKVETDPVLDQGGKPLAHHFRAPGRDGAFVYRQGFVRDDQVFIDAQHLPKTLACPACAVGVVEAEEVDGGLGESHSIPLNVVVKTHRFMAFGIGDALSFAFIEGSLEGIGKPVCCVLVVRRYFRPVDEHLDAVFRLFLLFRDLLEVFFDVMNCSIDEDAREPLAQEEGEVIHQLSALRRSQGVGNHDPGSGFERIDGVDHVGHRVAFYLLATYRGNGFTYPREEQLEIVVNLGSSSYGRSWIARVDLLFDGYGGGHARDVVDIGVFHSPKKLPRV